VCATRGHATRVRDVRGAAARGNIGTYVGLHGRHSTPLVYICATRGYVTRVRIRHPCTCTPLEYVTHVKLQHAVAAVQTWGCMDDTAPHSCTYTPLAGTSLMYVYAIRVRVRHSRVCHTCTWTWTCTGTWTPLVYVVTIRVRGSHSCKWTPCVDDTAHHACTPLAGMPYVYVDVYVYVDTTRVRGRHTRTWTSLVYVDTMRGRHGTPLVYVTRGHATRVHTRVRVRGHHSCTWSPYA
jgi:hypothetical protein